MRTASQTAAGAPPAAAAHGHPPRVLLVCHISAAAAASEAAAAVWPSIASHGVVELIAYGRSATRLPTPPGTRLIRLPGRLRPSPRSLREILRWVLALRRRRYDVVAVAQPSLGLSRARGLLLLFPHVVRGRHVLLIDPRARRLLRNVTLGEATADALRWVILQLTSPALAGGATLAARWVAGRIAIKRTAPLGGGPVVYLRTDIDLALAPLAAGGSVAHTVGVVRALRARGHPVEFWTTGDVAGLPPDVRDRRLPVVLRGNMPTELVELLSGVRQAIAGRRAAPASTAFVYQRYSLNNLAGLLLARSWGVPLVLEANGSEAKWRADWASVRFPGLAAATERLLLQQADRIVVVSRNAERDLLHAGAPRERTRVVPNGVEVERFARADPMPLPFLETAFVVAFVGLFYPWHGVAFLAEAFARLHERRPGARLLLVGDGEDAPVVRATLERAGCLRATHMTGLVPREQVPRYLAAADVVASPHADVRDFIGSPIKLFEYMASGRAIVASRLAQIGEVVRDEETALLVPPSNPRALAEALERLHDDPGLRERLGAAALGEARERHSWEARVEEMLGEDS